MDEKPRYIVIVEQYDKQLVKAVNEKIAEGYEPYGSVVIASNQTGVIKSFVQPMLLATS